MSKLPPSMPTLFRHLLFLAALAVMIGVVRPALAYAPFCDPRAASNSAPPVFTAIPDIRWEASPSFLIQQWCDQLQAARSLDRDLDPARDRFSESHWRTGPDMGSPLRAQHLPRRAKARRVPLDTERSKAPPGVCGRVYRPPR